MIRTLGIRNYGKIALFVLAVFLAFRWLLPFCLAFFTIALLHRFAAKAKQGSELSEKALTLFFLALFLLVAGAAVTLGIRTIIRESRGFFTSFSEAVSDLVAFALSVWERLKDRFSITDESEEKLASLLLSLLENAAGTLSSSAASLAGKLIEALPSFLVSSVFYLISLFYIATGYDRILSLLKRLVPAVLKAPLQKLLHATSALLSHTLKAYGILFLITFGILSIAFFLFGIDYPVWWAAITAFLDALPAIGIGIVLLPWGCVLLFSGQKTLGVAMLGLYLGMTLLRQVLEPRILGRKLGVDPLVSLLSLSLSFTLFGAWGLLLSPFLSVGITRLFYRFQEKGMSK